MRKITIINGCSDGTHSVFEEALSAEIEKYKANFSVDIFKLRDMKISYCTGCWSCWVKTPGLCSLKDDMSQILKSVAASDRTVFLSPVSMDFVTAQTKKVCERLIPLVHPYIEVSGGEFHHIKRYDSYPELGLLLIDPDKDVDRFDVIRHVFERLSITLKSSLPLSMMIDDTDKEAAHAVSSL